MGLFDGLKIMGDMISGGIEAAKAGFKLDELVERTVNEFDGKRTEAEKKLYTEYILIKDRHDKEKDQDKANAMIEDVEAAEVAYLTAISKNRALPAEFTSEVTVALIDFGKANNAAMDKVKARMLKMAKTDAERKEVEEMFN